MKSRINRILITIYALWYWLVNHFVKNEDNKNVLIIFQQIFGDSVFLVPVLDGLVKLYPKSLGYSVVLLCRPNIAQFLKEVAFIPKDLKIETMDYTKFLQNFKYFKTICNKYRFYPSITIVPGTSISAEILSSTLCSKKRYGLLPSVRRTHPLIMVLFQKIAYTIPIFAKEGLTTILQKKQLMKTLGLNEYKGKLSRLLPQKQISFGDYCVVCPGASVAAKMWPVERFIEVINFIISEYNMDVYLCGSKGEEYLSQTIVTKVSNPERIHSRIGDTSFKDWAALIEHCSLLLGNDSASVHIGVAYQRKVFCINGLYEKNIMYPYQVDVLETDERIPIVVSIDNKPCAYCRTKGYHIGYGNTKCKQALKEGKCASCIEEISVEMVIETIKKELQK